MEYIKAIEDTLGKEAQKEFLPGELLLTGLPGELLLTGLPGELLLTGLPMQPGDVPRIEADVTDLVEELGYKPDTLVHKGIERFIEWYKSYFN